MLCGDATNAGDVSKLIEGCADVMITSPPYGVADGKLRKHYEKGVELHSFYDEYEDPAGGEWFDLMCGFMDASTKFVKSRFVNVQMLSDNKRYLVEWLNIYKENLCDVIIWDKCKAPPQMLGNVLNNQFEFVFAFNETGNRQIEFGSFHGTQSNVLEIPTGHNEYSDIHKAVFPVALPDKLIDIAQNAETFYDPFCGTGTTIIACEQKGKRCYGMELSPQYCDLIIDRWEQFTGQKAVMIDE